MTKMTGTMNDIKPRRFIIENKTDMNHKPIRFESFKNAAAYIYRNREFVECSIYYLDLHNGCLVFIMHGYDALTYYRGKVELSM